MSRDQISLRRFEWLLKQRGYGFVPEARLEEVVTVRVKRPDYYVDTGRNLQFLAEVESFEKETVLRTSTARVLSIDPMSLQKRINRPVRNAADQLAPYATDNRPLVVVLDNHRQVGLQIERIELIELFGRIRYGITIDTSSGTAVSEGWEQDDDCPLGANKRQYVSAVVVNVPEKRLTHSRQRTTSRGSVPCASTSYIIRTP